MPLADTGNELQGVIGGVRDGREFVFKAKVRVRAHACIHVRLVDIQKADQTRALGPDVTHFEPNGIPHLVL